GHLVFSTLHTNNASGVIPRLMDMGVDPYLIAPTLLLAVAQRLVGLLPEGGGQEVKLDGSMKAIIDRSFSDLPPEFKKEVPFKDTVMKIKPTADAHKGTRGRMAVFEMFMMDKEIEQAILAHATEVEIQKIVRQKGMLSIKESAIVKAFERKIPIEEVNKL
ncbi:MAG: Flp pilus assembly complex ATPase component TadA, partial [Patescibacteria group bacterium]|nr:Flp pilus assembly complex ATPase component TadA [Patescibacteria group bacterium]